MPLPVCNPNLYPVEIPQRQPFAQVTKLVDDIQEEQVLESVVPDMVEITRTGRDQQRSC